MSGLIAGVVAMTLLVRSGAPANYSRQLIFAALAGTDDAMGRERGEGECYEGEIWGRHKAHIIMTQ